MKARLTDRDVRILVRLAVARWLTTAQIHRAYFPGATLNAVQKRLRKLSDAGYVRSYREHPTAEAVHAVGPKGKALVEEKGIEVVLGEEVPRQLEHLLGVNEIRIAIESSAVRVVFFFTYLQLAGLGWRHPVIPDAVFAVSAPAKRTFLLEYDRGTETLGKLVQKLQSYDRGIEGFSFEAVVIVAERPRRFDVLSREMRKKGKALIVMFATLDEVKEAGFFGTKFEDLSSSRKRVLLEPPEDQAIS